MPTPSILIATWDNGLYRFDGETFHQELADQSVRSLAGDEHGGVLAIVGGHSLYRRAASGDWTAMAKSEFDLSCCVPIADRIFVGTDDARILRVDPRAPDAIAKNPLSAAASHRAIIGGACGVAQSH